MLRRRAKQLVMPLVRAVGPLIRPVATAILWEAGIGTLKRSGFRPKTVFDIGVACGTPDLYAAFPEAHFILVDPTRESRPYMEKVTRRLDAEIFALALGDHTGEQEIKVRRDDIQGATFFREFGPLGPTDCYPVPVRRFNSLFADFARPALCKIDVQGAELMVLRGMGGRIRDIDVIIVETSTIATVAAAPELFDVMAFLKEQGFVIFDLVGMARRPLDRALAQLDLLMVREKSTFRCDHRWRA